MLFKNSALFFVFISLFSVGWSSDEAPETGLKRPASFERRDPDPKRLCTSSSSSSSSSLDVVLEEDDEVGEQIFARPVYDTTIKCILADPEVRLDFIRTFTGLKGIKSTEKLDDSLNPLKKLTSLRESLGDSKTKTFFERVNKGYFDIQVFRKDKKKEEPFIEDENGTMILKAISKNYKDLMKIFPEDRNSQVDVLCKLSDDRYTLVEVQVVPQDHWDKRSLAYLASIYGRQLSRGQKWGELNPVIGINILGGGPRGEIHWKSHIKPEKAINPIRHYQFQDKEDPSQVISEMQLIQYSLGNTDLDSDQIKDNPELHDWLDYLKNAHAKTKIPEDVGDALKKAYGLIKFDSMSEEMRRGYDKEEGLFSNISNYVEEEKRASKEEGMQIGKEARDLEIAKKMLQDKEPLEKIQRYTGLSSEDIQVIKDSLNLVSDD